MKERSVAVLFMFCISFMPLTPRASGSQAPGLSDLVKDYAAFFTGANPFDCAPEAPGAPADLEQAIDCALAASRRHQPFRAAPRARDVQGLLGTTEGVVYRFQIFPATSDGPLPPMFSIQRCPSPSVDDGRLVCYLPANRADKAQRPEEYLELVAGPDAVACGRLGIGNRTTDVELQRSLACAFAAGQRGQAFVVMKQYHGFDSDVYRGLLGDRTGAIFLFEYDSGPCGNPECFGQFDFGKCPEPAASGTGDYVKFTCQR
ncbi:MAG TPA: hypothetical protein VLT86_20115 [Vicinamibacterales bacterium]|nr:hypothetical protein [Vicinamibacterales bacterium]